MVAITRLQDTQWLVTETMPDQHAYLNILDEICIHCFTGVWKLAEIIALNDLTTSYMIADKVIFYSENDASDFSNIQPTAKLLPIAATLTHAEINWSILRALAHMILLQTAQTLGSRGVILVEGDLGQALEYQASEMGYQIGCLMNHPIDFVILAKSHLTAADYEIFKHCRAQSQVIVLKNTQIDYSQLIDHKLPLTIHTVDPHQILNETSWLAEATTYLRMNFQRAFTVQQSIQLPLMPSSDKKYTHLAEKLRISTIGVPETFTRLLSAVIHENSAIENLGHLVNSTQNELAVNSGADHQIFTSFNEVLNSTSNLVIIDVTSTSYDQLIELVKRKKSLVFLGIPSLNLTEWQQLLACAQANQVFVLPFIAHVRSRFVSKLCLDINDRVEPINILLRLPAQDEDALYWIFFCQIIVGHALLEVTTSIHLHGRLLACRFTDHSTAYIWLLAPSAQQPELMVTCQENTWNIVNWQQLESRKVGSYYRKKSANYQIGEVQLMLEIFTNMLDCNRLGLAEVWNNFIQSDSIIHLLQGKNK